MRNRYQPPAPPKKGRFLLVIAMGILVIAVGLVTFQYKKHPEKFPAASANFSRFANWIANRDHAARESKPKEKHLSENEEVPKEQIHFEFYKTLPNMKMVSTKKPDTISEKKEPTNDL